MSCGECENEGQEVEVKEKSWVLTFCQNFILCLFGLTAIVFLGWGFFAFCALVESAMGLVGLVATLVVVMALAMAVLGTK